MAGILKKETFIMPQQMIWFFVSIAFSFIAWGIVTARYIWPELRLRERAEALRPLLILHSFRFIGWHSWFPASWRQICRLPSRIQRPMGTSLLRYLRYFRCYCYPVRLALPSHGFSASGVQPIF
jgi:hypothetical protein